MAEETEPRHISELTAPCPICEGVGKYYSHGWEWEQREHRCGVCDGTGQISTEPVTLLDLCNLPGL